MMNETLRQRITALLDEGHDPSNAAYLALQEVHCDELRGYVLSTVEQLARHIERARVRQLEHEAFTGERRTTPDAVERLLAERFILPDGRSVRWGEATVDDHTARAAWLRDFARTVIETAERHERAVALIVEADVKCLNEVDLKGVTL